MDGKLVAEGIADQYREDLKKAGIGDGRHGFKIRLPLIEKKECIIKAFVNIENTELIKLENSVILINQTSLYENRVKSLIKENTEKIHHLGHQGYIESCRFILPINKLLIIGWLLFEFEDDILIKIKIDENYYVFEPEIKFNFYRKDIIDLFSYEKFIN